MRFTVTHNLVPNFTKNYQKFRAHPQTPLTGLMGHLCGIIKKSQAQRDEGRMKVDILKEWCPFASILGEATPSAV